MLSLYLQYINLLANIVLFGFIGYYLWRMHAKEQVFEKKEEKVDGDYHHIVNEALAKERKIIDDATVEANNIIANAKYTSETSKQMVHQALQKMIEDVHKETLVSAKVFIDSYHQTLQRLSSESMGGFSTIARQLEEDLKKQTTEFKTGFLPGLEKELADYKQVRIQQTEEIIKRVVQKVSQEVLNKSLSLEDHHQLMLASLERAKKEGIFE